MRWALLIFAFLPFSGFAESLDAHLHRFYSDLVVSRALQGPDQGPDLGPIPKEEVLTPLLQSYCAFMESRDQARVTSPERLILVDYTQAASEKRVYVLDLKRHRILHQTYGTHGIGSVVHVQLRLDLPNRSWAENQVLYESDLQDTRFFSNRSGSKASSLGLAIGDRDTYLSPTFGSPALHLKGMDSQLNSKLYDRGVVFHEWGYRDAEVRRVQQSPPSEGCLMFPKDDEFEGQASVNVNQVMMDSAKGSLVFLVHERMLNPELNERMMKEDLERYDYLSQDLIARIQELSEELGWSPAEAQSRLQGFQEQLKSDLLSRAKETYEAVKKGRGWIGKTPRDPIRCMDRLGQ